MARRTYKERNFEEPMVENVKEKVEEPLVKEEPKNVDKKFPKGVVTNCLQLNVRREPSMKAEVLTIISALDEVRINSEQDDWYEVVLNNGTRGFCKKAFIAKE